jgi:demethylspheroidene O-methyltransferase
MRPAQPVQSAQTLGPGATAADWWHRWQDRIAGWVASPGFRRWAASFPLTRPLVRRRAARLFDLVAGFVYSQVLLACVRLRLFDELAGGADTAPRLAERHGLPLRSMQRLLDAAVSLELLARRPGGHYALGPLGAPMVGNAGLSAMVEHHAALYADLDDPLALLRAEGAGSRMAAYWPYARGGAPAGVAGAGNPVLPTAATADATARYSALMTASQSMVIEELLAAYDFSRHRQLLDVGGGEGRFVASVLVQAPRLRAQLFDLPAVADLARQRLAVQGLAGRVVVQGGSFFEPGTLPTGADVATLVRVLFDHDDAHAVQILEAAFRALAPGGTLVVAEPMAGVRGAHAMGDAYFGLYLLAMGRGQPRSAEALSALLHQAGFEAVRSRGTNLPLHCGVLVAHKPARS